ncbi:ATP-binding protein [Streptomyces sp. NRRL F-5053]|uniref:ATP-binding protein n=1 Tax=Streptomyces sp. NRRL F-5053 TaxID=1463854 RepID=UPI0004C8A06C|nr:ATP-binding protein [Streptomyces sp. NRRL F-5053]
MRMPVRHLAGNVLWTRHGTVWAVWRVESEGQAHASAKARTARLKALESLVKKLLGESMWLSLCPQVDPYAVVRQMTEGLVLCERYEALAHRVLDELEQLELTARTDWLAVPLAAEGWRGRVREVLRAARADMAVQLGLMPAPVTARQERARLAQARTLAKSWPATVPVRPASEAEILWMYGHAARRGVLEPLLPEPDAPRPVRGRGRGVAALEQAVLLEGGLPEARDGENEGVDAAADEKRGNQGRFSRRWLEVATPWGASYQGLMALSEMPERFVFPGSEYLARLDDFAFPVDWVMRLQVTPGATAEARTRRQAREVAQQPEEYAADPAGAPGRVHEAAPMMAEFRDRVTAASHEVEVRAMGALCVWGATPAEAEARAGQLAGFFSEHEYTLTRPVGEQERLWYGMLPGARTPPVMLQHAQYLLARDFCMAGPYSAAGLGDERGPLFGMQLTGGGCRPVLADWTRGPRKKTSASAAFIGELGSGKSTAMKAAVYYVLAAGRRQGRPRSRGRALVVDRTRRQEWVHYVRACPGSHQIIEVGARAQVSLDPLRLLTRRRDGRPADVATVHRRTETFLTMLLGLSPMDEIADALSEAIDTVLQQASPSMPGLVGHLDVRAEAGDADARALVRKLRRHARNDLGRTVFDGSLPALDATADAVVFSTPTLRLPTQRELENRELFRKLPQEAVFGRAVLYLIAALCQHIAFEDPEEFCEVVWDEVWWLTRSPEGLELLLELVRDGRKHNAGCLVGSHDPDDIGPDTPTGQIVRGLFPRRHLFRQTDETLARRGLAFLGLDPADEDLLTLVTTELSPLHASVTEQAARAGECLARDLYGRIGTLRVLIPLDPRAAEAIHSDPGSDDDSEPADERPTADAGARALR